MFMAKRMRDISTRLGISSGGKRLKDETGFE
jgi:hypothetical protein